MDAVIGRRRYSTDTGTLLADDDYGGGGNAPRTTSLYRAPGGAYFAFYETSYVDEVNHIEELTPEEAEIFYEGLPCKSVAFEIAFPDVPVEDA